MIDTERYGGRRAYLAHLAARAKTLAGLYSPFMKVEWKAVDRLVFICKGNICRSPYAAARARELGLDAVSFGLDALDGVRADFYAEQNASRRHLDLSAHRSRKLRACEVRDTDLVLLFEPQHLDAYHGICGNRPAALSLLGLWTDPQRPYISDPFGKSDRYFQECFLSIDSGLRRISEKITSAVDD